MSKLCERPGCSEPGAAAYGMVAEDLLFWIAPLADAPVGDPNVLCRRHADAMVVPRGWTLDDRRENEPRLFKPHVTSSGHVLAQTAPVPTRRRRHRHDDQDGEQLQIDGTGETTRPDLATIDTAAIDTADIDPADSDPADGAGVQPWQPDFDASDDLGGLLEVDSPLLARAFRGTDRPRR